MTYEYEKSANKISVKDLKHNMRVTFWIGIALGVAIGLFIAAII